MHAYALAILRTLAVYMTEPTTGRHHASTSHNTRCVPWGSPWMAHASATPTTERAKVSALAIACQSSSQSRTRASCGVGTVRVVLHDIHV